MAASTNNLPQNEEEPGAARQVQALVLAPTRELAIQVAEELNKIGETKRVYALPVYGGQQIDRQIRGLKKNPQIMILHKEEKHFGFI